MKFTQLFTKTLKEAPSDERAKNAQLLIRAGYIHKEMAGVYVYMPLGMRVLESIKQVVREEMDDIGGQEVIMSTLQPKEIWEQTNRWDDDVVDNWFKTALKNGTELGVGLTHEEPIVDMLKPYVSSYKDLPLLVYQIQNKFRNELRAKSGLLRGREFVMKDMYTFARSQEEHDELYERVAGAYTRVYERLGIGDITHRVKADGGYFTEKHSDEYQTVCPSGEDILLHVPGTDIYYNEEVAPAQSVPCEQDSDKRPMREVETVDIVGVDDLAKHLEVPVEQTTKTLIYEVMGSDRVIVAVVRGDYEVNEIKLARVAGASQLRLASKETVKRITGAEVGYAGLIGLPDNVAVYVDESCQPLVNFETGANRTNYHNIDVNWGVDVDAPATFYDIKLARAGDIHPESAKAYESMRSIEVGNIFPLESKYSDALDLRYTDESGQQHSIIMGCYGIGVSRLMGSIAEHLSDERGLVWPAPIAPFHVYLIAIGDDFQGQALEIAENLESQGISVLHDDRDVRPGEKFADAELLGIPERVVLSKKTLEQGGIEIVSRISGETAIMALGELHQTLKERLKVN